MQRQLMLAAVAGGVMIVAGAAVSLFATRSLPAVGAQSATPSNSQNPPGSQSPPQGGQRAIGVIVLGKSPEVNPPAVPTPEEAVDTGNDEQRRDEPLDLRLWSPAESTVRERITSELADLVPEGVPLLAHEGSPDSPPEEIFSVLMRILEAAQSATPSRQPALFLAADLLADKLDLGMKAPPPPQIQEKLDSLARYGLSYSWDELGASWAYSHNLLWRVWRNYPSSPWAEDAFLLLLARDWDTGFDCKGGSDSFRAIIREGEDFLTTHGQSRYRREVTYQVAQAYETWWSLSRAKACGATSSRNCDEYVSPEEYVQGAEEARRKSIESYEHILAGDPSGIMAADARRRLEDLKANVDTLQRRFYCIYD